jgi:hypothetical protein
MIAEGGKLELTGIFEVPPSEFKLIIKGQPIVVDVSGALVAYGGPIDDRL